MHEGNVFESIYRWIKINEEKKIEENCYTTYTREEKKTEEPTLNRMLESCHEVVKWKAFLTLLFNENGK